MRWMTGSTRSHSLRKSLATKKIADSRPDLLAALQREGDRVILSDTSPFNNVNSLILR